MADSQMMEVKKRKYRSTFDHSANPANKRNRRNLDLTKHTSPSYSENSANLPTVMIFFGEKNGERMEMMAFDFLKGMIMD